MKRLIQSFPQARVGKILDVGGTSLNWSYLPEGLNVTLANLYENVVTEAGHTQLVADGRFLPFKDKAFDLVFCNSVIEHLGNYADQRLLSEEIQRVGKAYFVQTPNRWFPLEPHYLTPLIHFVPVTVRRRLVRNFTLWGLMTRPSPERVGQMIKELRLLTPSEMRQLFPNAVQDFERFWGLKKSILAQSSK